MAELLCFCFYSVTIANHSFSVYCLSVCLSVRKYLSGRGQPLTAVLPFVLKSSACAIPTVLFFCGLLRASELSAFEPQTFLKQLVCLMYSDLFSFFLSFFLSLCISFDPSFSFNRPLYLEMVLILPD